MSHRQIFPVVTLGHAPTAVGIYEVIVLRFFHLTMRKKFLRSQRGQLSIFMATSTLVLIAFLAFVINVGLFVKAKINLQNAVDAAAWSGAAVQARQLTDIAYLNWELRNTYKEWMYKYYVLGQISMPKIWPTNLNNRTSRYMQPHPTNMSFRLNPFWKEGSGGNNYRPEEVDKYNAPSTCISFKAANNICETYGVPGIPRFEIVGMAGLSEHNEAFLNQIVKAKQDDCSMRTILNFSTAIAWVYGTGTTQTIPGQPDVATGNVGSWIQALELALRIRNLEMIVNRPAISEGICTSGEGGCLTITELNNMHHKLPLDERPVKAFLSAYRNLGGDENNDLKQTFKLFELPPNAVPQNAETLSTFLIPEDAHIGNTPTLARVKQYLDLQIIPLNLATFFTSFVSTTKKFTTQSGSQRDAEAACAGSKTAIPVPGYIFGFVKNPATATYYAVKGEAKYRGLFYPFADPKGITIKTYASAKPFGGRIGPRIFGTDVNGLSVIPRTENRQSWSAPYVSTLKVPPTVTEYTPGDPIPMDRDFWSQDDTTPIGGVPARTGDIYFAIPNLLYDFPDNTMDISSQLGPQGGGGRRLQGLDPITRDTNMVEVKESVGLYNQKQFSMFQDGLNVDQLQVANVYDYLSKARRPTKYEALNYMIPTFDNENARLDSSSAVINVSEDPAKIKYKLYGPIIGDETLYRNDSKIVDIINKHIANNLSAIQTYMGALKRVAQKIKAYGETTQGGDATAAANMIYDLDNEQGLVGQADIVKECQSMAGKFWQLFVGRNRASNPASCNIEPIPEMVTQYVNRASSEADFANYYVTSYYAPETPDENKKLLTAFMPGPRQGAGENGENLSPFLTPSGRISRRNYYSTKLVSIKKFVETNVPSDSYWAQSIFSNSRVFGDTPSDQNISTDVNKLNPDDLVEFGELYF
ncbi:MAG TPA: Tad domain-containing protein [Bacteriovoracaceae bacterium]|nr:Tad domain-containing protein [Bacteriovoracaceae bacterium]